MSDPTSGSTGDNADHPSMIGGHAKYIQGAVSSMLGYKEGEDTKRSAVEEMKAANEQTQPHDQPAQSSILGTVEKKIGELTGCEGMEKEGNQRIPAGSEETSGTG